LDKDLDADVFNEIIFSWVVLKPGMRGISGGLPDVRWDFTIEK
jgi:hypothetical protein